MNRLTIAVIIISVFILLVTGVFYHDAVEEYENMSSMKACVKDYLDDYGEEYGPAMYNLVYGDDRHDTVIAINDRPNFQAEEIEDIMDEWEDSLEAFFDAHKTCYREISE